MAETTAALLLQQWLLRQAPPAGAAWLVETCAALAAKGSDRELEIAVSGASRRLGKQTLALSSADLGAADAVCAGWRPGRWTLDQAGRVLLLLSASGVQPLADRLVKLSTTADISTLIALYRGLPLYPDAPTYLAWAAEGARTSMRAVFEAVAHENPYPAAHFPEAAWNQMVLKALFIDSSLHPIIGLDERSNPALARMLCDYAHERWAAARPVSYELWRCVGRHADAAARRDLARVLESGSFVERQAAALALRENTDPEAAALLASVRLSTDIETRGGLSWDALHERALAV